MRPFIADPSLRIVALKLAKLVLMLCPTLLMACATRYPLPADSNKYAYLHHQVPQTSEAPEAKMVMNDRVRERPLQQEAGPVASPSERVQFKLYPAFLFLPMTAADQITFLEPNTKRQGILIGNLSESKNPCRTMNEFREKAATAAAILGGQAILIRDGSSRAGDPDGRAITPGFVAELLLLPRARLGIQDEAGHWPRKELVVQGFESGSLAPASGLKVGDRVVALNGVDVLYQERFAQGWRSWNVGETVVITFVRDGIVMTTQATTIEN